MPIVSDRDRILIGVASWSRYDLELLDRLHAHVRDCVHPAIDVFDVDECHNFEDFERYVPGIGRVFSTPVVGVWRNGVLVSSAWGFKGRQLLAQNGLVA